MATHKPAIAPPADPSTLPEPPVPAGTDLSWAKEMPLDTERLLLVSKFWRITCKRNPALAFPALNLWMRAWRGRPPASLPNDDDELCEMAMLDPQKWAENRAQLIGLFTLCSDGRLYHPVIAEYANRVLGTKRKHHNKAVKASAARWGNHKKQQDNHPSLLLDASNKHPTSTDQAPQASPKTPILTPSSQVSPNSYAGVNTGNNTHKMPRASLEHHRDRDRDKKERIPPGTPPTPASIAAPLPAIKDWPEEIKAQAVKISDAFVELRNQLWPNDRDQRVAPEMMIQQIASSFLALDGATPGLILDVMRKQLGGMAARGSTAVRSLGVIRNDVKTACAFAADAADQRERRKVMGDDAPRPATNGHAQHDDDGPLPAAYSHDDAETRDWPVAARIGYKGTGPLVARRHLSEWRAGKLATGNRMEENDAAFCFCAGEMEAAEFQKAVGWLPRNSLTQARDEIVKKKRGAAGGAGRTPGGPSPAAGGGNRPP